MLGWIDVAVRVGLLRIFRLLLSLVDPIFWTRKGAFLRWWAALKIEESQWNDKRDFACNRDSTNSVLGSPAL
jgi:hypothetical protein